MRICHSQLSEANTGEAIANTGEAIAAFPGRVQATAEYLVNLPGETARKAQAFADGVNNVVTNVVSFPGRVKAASRGFRRLLGRRRRRTWWTG